MNISHFRFVLFNLKSFNEIVTTLKNTLEKQNMKSNQSIVVLSTKGLVKNFKRKTTYIL